MQIVSPNVPTVNPVLEQLAYGYRLALANQPIELCTNLQQRRGFAQAERGALAAEMAAADCQTAAYLQGSR